MKKKEISSRQLRESQSDVLNKVAFRGEHYIVTRNGKEAAAIISVDEFHFLQTILNELEDDSDIRDAEKTLSEVKKKGAIPIEVLAKELGIDV